MLADLRVIQTCGLHISINKQASKDRTALLMRRTWIFLESRTDSAAGHNARQIISHSIQKECQLVCELDLSVCEIADRCIEQPMGQIEKVGRGIEFCNLQCTEYRTFAGVIIELLPHFFPRPREPGTMYMA